MQRLAAQRSSSEPPPRAHDRRGAQGGQNPPGHHPDCGCYGRPDEPFPRPTRSAVAPGHCCHPAPSIFARAPSDRLSGSPPSAPSRQRFSGSSDGNAAQLFPPPSMQGFQYPLVYHVLPPAQKLVVQPVPGVHGVAYGGVPPASPFLLVSSQQAMHACRFPYSPSVQAGACYCYPSSGAAALDSLNLATGQCPVAPPIEPVPHSAPAAPCAERRGPPVSTRPPVEMRYQPPRPEHWEASGRAAHQAAQPDRPGNATSAAGGAIDGEAAKDCSLAVGGAQLSTTPFTSPLYLLSCDGSAGSFSVFTFPSPASDSDDETEGEYSETEEFELVERPQVVVTEHGLAASAHLLGSSSDPGARDVEDRNREGDYGRSPAPEFPTEPSYVPMHGYQLQPNPLVQSYPPYLPCAAFGDPWSAPKSLHRCSTLDSFAQGYQTQVAVPGPSYVHQTMLLGHPSGFPHLHPPVAAPDNFYGFPTFFLPMSKSPGLLQTCCLPQAYAQPFPSDQPPLQQAPCQHGQQYGNCYYMAHPQQQQVPVQCLHQQQQPCQQTTSNGLQQPAQSAQAAAYLQQQDAQPDHTSQVYVGTQPQQNTEAMAPSQHVGLVSLDASAVLTPPLPAYSGISQASVAQLSASEAPAPATPARLPPVATSCAAAAASGQEAPTQRAVGLADPALQPPCSSSYPQPASDSGDLQQFPPVQQRVVQTADQLMVSVDTQTQPMNAPSLPTARDVGPEIQSKVTAGVDPTPALGTGGMAVAAPLPPETMRFCGTTPDVPVLRSAVTDAGLLYPAPGPEEHDATQGLPAQLLRQMQEEGFASGVGEMNETQTAQGLTASDSVASDATSAKELSENEATGGSSRVDSRHSKRHRKSIRKSRQEKSVKPRVTILNVAEEGDKVVECQMETHNHKTVTFKFEPDYDDPEEIADYMVVNNFILDSEKEIFTEQIKDIVEKVDEMNLWAGNDGDCTESLDDTYADGEREPSKHQCKHSSLKTPGSLACGDATRRSTVVRTGGRKFIVSPVLESQLEDIGMEADLTTDVFPTEPWVPDVTNEKGSAVRAGLSSSDSAVSLKRMFDEMRRSRQLSESPSTAPPTFQAGAPPFLLLSGPSVENAAVPRELLISIPGAVCRDPIADGVAEMPSPEVCAALAEGGGGGGVGAALVPCGAPESSLPVAPPPAEQQQAQHHAQQHHTQQHSSTHAQVPMSLAIPVLEPNVTTKNMTPLLAVSSFALEPSPLLEHQPCALQLAVTPGNAALPCAPVQPPQPGLPPAAAVDSPMVSPGSVSYAAADAQTNVAQSSSQIIDSQQINSEVSTSTSEPDTPKVPTQPGNIKDLDEKLRTLFQDSCSSSSSVSSATYGDGQRDPAAGVSETCGADQGGAESPSRTAGLPLPAATAATVSANAAGQQNATPFPHAALGSVAFPPVLALAEESLLPAFPEQACNRPPTPPTSSLPSGDPAGLPFLPACRSRAHSLSPYAPVGLGEEYGDGEHGVDEFSQTHSISDNEMVTISRRDSQVSAGMRLLPSEARFDGESAALSLHDERQPVVKLGRFQIIPVAVQAPKEVKSAAEVSADPASPTVIPSVEEKEKGQVLLHRHSLDEYTVDGSAKLAAVGAETHATATKASDVHSANSGKRENHSVGFKNSAPSPLPATLTPRHAKEQGDGSAARIVVALNQTPSKKGLVSFQPMVSVIPEQSARRDGEEHDEMYASLEPRSARTAEHPYHEARDSSDEQRSPSFSSDLDSDPDEGDLKKELQKLRERHLKELSELQMQQRREMEELYEQLGRLPPNPAGLAQLVPPSGRRWRNGKGARAARAGKAPPAGGRDEQAQVTAATSPAGGTLGSSACVAPGASLVDALTSAPAVQQDPSSSAPPGVQTRQPRALRPVAEQECVQNAVLGDGSFAGHGGGSQGNSLKRLCLGKDRSRSRSYSANQHGGQQAQAAQAAAAAAGPGNKKGTFTDDLHKLVDDWAKDATNSTNSSIKTKHGQNRQDPGSGRQKPCQTESSPVVVIPPTMRKLSAPAQLGLQSGAVAAPPPQSPPLASACGLGSGSCPGSRPPSVPYMTPTPMAPLLCAQYGAPQGSYGGAVGMGWASCSLPGGQQASALPSQGVAQYQPMGNGGVQSFPVYVAAPTSSPNMRTT